MLDANKVQNKKYGNQKLSEWIEKMYLNSETADVYFEVVDDDGAVERVPAHKFPLAAVSDVFMAMFYGQLKEEGDVKLIDVTAEAMKEFLQFFYMREVELTMENIAEVMHLGHKYNVTRCVDVCVQFVEMNLTNDNICTGLGLALVYDQKELLNFCDLYIACNTKALFASTNFLECDKPALEHILKMNRLSCSETEMFAACMSWVKAKSKQDELTKETVQTYLGDLFYEIRFTSMTPENFFTLHLSHNHLFSFDEYNDIAQTFTPTGTSPQLFNGNPREVQWNKDAVIKCDRVKPNGAEGNVRLKMLQTTAFSSHQPVLLGGFVCAKVRVWRDNNYIDLTNDLPIDITVFEDPDLNHVGIKTLCNLKASLTSTSEILIQLSKPVLIRPGFIYRIILKQSPDDHFYYYKELIPEVKIVNANIITFYNDQTTMKKQILNNLIISLEFNN